MPSETLRSGCLGIQNFFLERQTDASITHLYNTWAGSGTVELTVTGSEIKAINSLELVLPGEFVCHCFLFLNFRHSELLKHLS